MINTDCPCKRVKCERHGDCEACREHHHTSLRKPLTSCERKDQKEERRAERREKREH